MKITKCLKLGLVLSCILMVTDAAKKNKRGLYHGLHGYAVPLGVGLHRPYHPSPYAKFPGLYKGLGGVLPPGYALFPGSASVTSFHRNFPKVPAVYAPNYYPAFGVPATGVVRPVTSLSPVAPVAPLAPAFPAIPQIPAAQAPVYIPLGTPQQTSFFATYPQKPFIPVAIPAPEKPKFPVVVPQKPVFTTVSNFVPSNLFPAGVYNPTVAVSNVSPTFVGIPVGPTVTTPTVSTATVTQTAQQPWRPVLVNHPTATPSTTTVFKPSLNLLPPFTLPANAQGQIYISSTPATHVQDSQQQQQQTLLDLEQASLHHQGQEDGSGAFNGQPYDVASNHGRYSGPSSYDVDITHNGYQKK
nr:protein app1-like [Aedes albopictus]